MNNDRTTPTNPAPAKDKSPQAPKRDENTQKAAENARNNGGSNSFGS